MPVMKSDLEETQLVARLKLLADGSTLRDLATEMGVSYQNLNMVILGKRSPGKLIPRALGYEPVTIYRPIEAKKAGKP
jgi:lambda repressor-like predicted transcriptional regulator